MNNATTSQANANGVGSPDRLSCASDITFEEVEAAWVRYDIACWNKWPLEKEEAAADFDRKRAAYDAQLNVAAQPTARTEPRTNP